MKLPSLVCRVLVVLLVVVSLACGCPRGYYKNKEGRCVASPVKSNTAPAGATAKCRDGSYSFSRSRRGTCSHHGGVAQWLD